MREGKMTKVGTAANTQENRAHMHENNLAMILCGALLYKSCSRVDSGIPDNAGAMLSRLILARELFIAGCELCVCEKFACMVKRTNSAVKSGRRREHENVSGTAEKWIRDRTKC